MKMADVSEVMSGCKGCVWLALFKLDNVFTQLRPSERSSVSHSAAVHLNNSDMFSIGHEVNICTGSVGTRQVEFFVTVHSEYAFTIECIEEVTGMHMGSLKGLAIKNY